MEKETFIHPSENRESKVAFSKGRLLGHGGQGKVYEVTANIKGRERRMALKEFPEEDRRDDGQHSRAEIAFSHYQQAQKVGLRIFKTFRLSEDKRSILMTNGHDEKTICLGTNNADRVLAEELGGEYIEYIENFDEFLNNVYKEIEKAIQNKFELAGDAIFFLLDRKTKSHLDFVIGDLDICGQTTSKINVAFAIQETEEQIIYFLKKYLKETIREFYIRKTQNFFKAKTQ